MYEIPLHFCKKFQAVRVFLYLFSRVKNQILRSLDAIHEKHNSRAKAYMNKPIEIEIYFH